MDHGPDTQAAPSDPGTTGWCHGGGGAIPHRRFRFHTGRRPPKSLPRRSLTIRLPTFRDTLLLKSRLLMTRNMARDYVDYVYLAMSLEDANLEQALAPARRYKLPSSGPWSHDGSKRPIAYHWGFVLFVPHGQIRLQASVSVPQYRGPFPSWMKSHSIAKPKACVGGLSCMKHLWTMRGPGTGIEVSDVTADKHRIRPLYMGPLYNLVSAQGGKSRLAPMSSPIMQPGIVPLLSPFASLFDVRTWRKAVSSCCMGAVLAPGRRTVCACLRVLGRQAEPVALLADRARWSALAPPTMRTRAVPWCLAWTRPSSGARGRALKPRGCTGTRYAPRTATSSRPWACAGSA